MEETTNGCAWTMLVYLKNPMAYTSIDGKRVYGRKYAYGSMGPTNVSRESFKKYREILEETEYTKSYLDEKFNGNFPDVSFKVSEISKLDFLTLVKVAKSLGIKYHRRRVSPTNKEVLALRRAVIGRLNS